MPDPDRTAPRAFYDEYGDREWDRLERDFHHRLEWEGTIDRLETHLPDSDRDDNTTKVLDVGGGAGRYSIWLAERGYRVTLVELSATQRAVAREHLDERDLRERVAVRAGDVRELDFEDDSFDATVCLGGPLSHVLDDAERGDAVAELARVTVPDGPVLVSVMGLLGLVLMATQYGGRGDGPDALPLLPELLQTQEYTGDMTAGDGEPLMADTHFFRRSELSGLLSDAGLDVRSIDALEGVAACRRTHLEDLDESARDVIRAVNDRLRSDPTIADVSPHMLAVCRA